ARCRRILFLMRAAENVRPDWLAGERGCNREADQGAGSDVRSRYANSTGVGLVFVRTCQNESVSVENRPEPVDEAEEHPASTGTLLGHLLEDLSPRFAHAIQPIAKSSVAARRVSELVRENGFELLRRDHQHQRQTERQIRLMTAEDPEPWDLHDAGVGVCRHEDRVKRSAVQRGTQFTEQPEQT